MSDTGSRCYRLIENLFPICRSITGDGVRQTLNIISQYIPLERKEVPSGTKVFDWNIPKEWNIRDAFIKNPEGDKIIDFKKSNLHVVNYSIPVHKKLPLAELKKNLHTLPNQPDWIPYKTTYYKETWGFCLPHAQLGSLREGEYEVCIDSTLESGSLTYGEFFIPGKVKKEVLISTHICHPSLCNDNLSGIAVAVFAAELLASIKNQYSYRFLFIPGTIGAITWLAKNRERVNRIKHGLVLSGLGDYGPLHYKKSRQGTAEIDRVVEYVLRDSADEGIVRPFHPYGYDERQYCSPGFNLPVGCLSRTPYGQYPEYHTSADNLDFVSPDKLDGAYHCLISILNILENNRTYINLNPYCEPQLGRRGLYSTPGDHELAILWVLNQSDGYNSLLDIVQKSNCPWGEVYEATCRLVEHSLLEEKADEI